MPRALARDRANPSLGIEEQEEKGKGVETYIQLMVMKHVEALDHGNHPRHVHDEEGEAYGEGTGDSDG